MLFILLHEPQSLNLNGWICIGRMLFLLLDKTPSSSSRRTRLRLNNSSPFPPLSVFDDGGPRSKLSSSTVGTVIRWHCTHQRGVCHDHRPSSSSTVGQILSILVHHQRRTFGGKKRGRSALFVRTTGHSSSESSPWLQMHRIRLICPVPSP
jgi:hypothetical protein